MPLSPWLYGLAGKLKELRRTVALEVWGNRYAVRALEEISRAYRDAGRAGEPRCHV